MMTAIDKNFLVATGPIIPELSNHPGITGNALQKYSLKPIAEAAIGAEKPTKNDTQPLRKPKTG